MRKAVLAMAMGGVFALAAAGGAAAQDAAAGKTAFAVRCGGCHQVGTTASAGSGPLLKGVVGRKIASLTDFTYSPALKAKGGVWSAANLDAFLTSPIKFAPGGKMYTAVTAPADRANLIAYLKTVK